MKDSNNEINASSTVNDRNSSSLHPDSPCIGYCSTSFGDDWCVGCGSSSEEVINWITYGEIKKREIWIRVESEGIAFRFRK